MEEKEADIDIGESRDRSRRKDSGCVGDEIDHSKYQCYKCKKVYSRKDILTRHIRTQHDDKLKVHQCPICEVAMIRLDHLRRHIINIHKEDPAKVLSTRPKALDRSEVIDRREPLLRAQLQGYVCEYEDCGKEMSRRDHLSQHIRRVHKADPADIMGETFMKSRKRHRYALSEGVKERSWPNTSGKNSQHQQPNENTLSNSESDDLDYAELEEEEQHEILEEGKVLEDEAVICLLCCNPYYPSEGNSPQISNFSDNFNLNNLVSEVVQSNVSHHLNDLTSSKNLYVCSDCIDLVGRAMSKKLALDEVEFEVMQTQRRMMEEMRILQDKLRQYSADMYDIGSVVTGADKIHLNSFLRRNLLSGRKQENSLVVLLRTGIVSMANKLLCSTRQIKQFNDELDGKMTEVLSEYRYPNEGNKTTEKVSSDITRAKRKRVPSIELNEENKRSDPSGDSENMNSSRITHTSKRSVGSNDDEIAGSASSTTFKKKLIKTTQSLSRRRQQSLENNSSQALKNGTVLSRLEYTPNSDQFAVGSVTVLLHEEQRILECSSCEFQAKGANSKSEREAAVLLMEEHIVNRHLSDNELQEKPYKCTTSACNKKFRTQKKLNKHIQSTHFVDNNETLYTCRKGCNAIFKKMKHRRKHEEDCMD